MTKAASPAISGGVLRSMNKFHDYVSIQRAAMPGATTPKAARRLTWTVMQITQSKSIVQLPKAK